jgi:hypothetical protein
MVVNTQDLIPKMVDVLVVILGIGPPFWGLATNPFQNISINY